MIPILKNSNEETIAFLVDALTCTVTEERNGAYTSFSTVCFANHLTHQVRNPLFVISFHVRFQSHI